MNYYNPYFFPYTTSNTGLLSRFFGRGISFSGILNGTSKTLNLINQAIPIVKQAKPILNNAKTMFKVMNEFKKTEKKETAPAISIQKIETNNPTFFV